ncbi:DUF1385 domain-containing protein [Nanoarchaeota archaeon]
MAKELHIGGQAVIEGVMMRSRDILSVAVRRPNKKIVVKKIKAVSLTKKKPWGFPFVRGVIVLGETVYLGLKALSWSASQATDDDEQELSSWEIAGTIVFSLVLALVLFKLLPLLIASLIPNAANNILFNLIDGIAKIAILVGYIWAISLMSDVKRLFQYHGAEHMAVNCYEEKKRLTIANVRKYPKEHFRCGTSFILIVLLLSILFYMFIPLSLSFWAKYAWRIALLPVIAGVSYEIIRLAGKSKDSKFIKIISYPGVLLQHITTREPDDEMIEVAIKSLKAAVS